MVVQAGGATHGARPARVSIGRRADGCGRAGDRAAVFWPSIGSVYTRIAPVYASSTVSPHACIGRQGGKRYIGESCVMCSKLNVSTVTDDSSRIQIFLITDY